MKQEGENSHEYGMLYDYLDFVTTLSWKKEETVSIDLEEAEQILDEDHYGLKKIKERIIQQLAGHEAEKQTVGFYSAVCGPARNRQRPVSARASPGRWDGSMSGSVWAESGMRRRYAATDAPISEPCPAGSWRE